MLALWELHKLLDEQYELAIRNEAITGDDIASFATWRLWNIAERDNKKKTDGKVQKSKNGIRRNKV